MLNLGCGNRFHPAWVNVDFSARPPGVIGYNLRRGIPFGDDSFQIVYHSHLLEHFHKDAAERFLRECYRVLMPGGVMRVAVPDLRKIAELYLDRLDEALRGEPGAEADYDWTMLELYDQVVRRESGGQMKHYLGKAEIPNKAFIMERMGWGKPADNGIMWGAARPVMRQPRWRGFLRPSGFVERLRRLLLGDDYQVLQEGRFRRSGEVHEWMYDEFSLGRLMRSVGLEDVRRCGASESRIPDWAGFLLDTNADGSVRKPDSLFMEGRK